MDFIWVSNATKFFLEIGRNYAPVIITIFRNITVSMSHNVICLGYLMAMSRGINKKAPTVISLTLPPNRISTRFVCWLTRNTLSTSFLLCSNKLLQKIMHFQSKTNFFFQIIAGRF